MAILPYIQGVSELIARHQPYYLTTERKPTEALRKALVHVKDPPPFSCRDSGMS